MYLSIILILSSVLTIFPAVFSKAHVYGSREQIDQIFNKNLLHENLLIFLSEALHNFPTWVEKNKLDPFQMTGEFVTLKNTNTNITLTVTNQFVSGLSRVTHVFNTAVSVGLDARSFDVSYATNDKILLGGDYQATGLYQGNIQLNSRGKFLIVCSQLWQEICFDNLTISEHNKYVPLYTGHGSISIIPKFENVTFTNINFDEDQSILLAINKELGDMYYNFVSRKVVSENNTVANPSTRLLKRYINTIFWRTKIMDIINWPSFSNWDAFNHSPKITSNVFIVLVLMFLASIN